MRYDEERKQTTQGCQVRNVKGRRKERKKGETKKLIVFHTYPPLTFSDRNNHSLHWLKRKDRGNRREKCMWKEIRSKQLDKL